MPREIKFRAWDYTQYKMREVEALLSVCDGSWSVSYDDENYTDDIELMQYTGLHDKNGKEIYEEDIVKQWCGEHPYMNMDDLEYESEYSTEIVKYSGFGFFAGDYGIGEVELEVIGNIYENPELLEDK